MNEKTASKSKSKDKVPKSSDKLKKDESSEVISEKKKEKSEKGEKKVKEKKSKKEVRTDDMDKDILHDPLLDDLQQENQKNQNFNTSYYDQMMSRRNNMNFARQGSENIHGISPQQGERCDGCYDGEGICFCVNCEKVYCKLCEEQLHVVPSNRNHERVPISDVHHLKKLCYHHNNPLKFYCESCEEPICHECQMIGPHNNKLHRITSVFESFRKKFNYVNSLVQKHLLSKYDQLTGQIQYIEFLIEEVKTVKNGIERDIRAEYSQMIEKLRSEEGKKLAILQYESAILQKELNHIQDIIMIINQTNTNETPDMIAFLLKYKQINENVELCLSKPLKKNIEINTEDFPRELDEQKAKLERYEKMKKLMKVKDDIIWNLLLGKKESIGQEFFDLKEKTKNEISEWVKLSDKYALELKKYNLVCTFCGCFLEESTVNSLCKNNIPDEKSHYYFCSTTPPTDIINTKRHFFAPPSKEYESKIKSGSDKQVKPITSTANNLIPVSFNNNNPFERNILNESKYVGAMTFIPEQQSRGRSTSPPVMSSRYSEETNSNLKEKTTIHEWIRKMSSVIEKEKVNFYQLLADYDKNGDGYIEPEEIRMAYMKLGISLDAKDVENILKYFKISQGDKIDIRDFSKMIMEEHSKSQSQSYSK